MHLPGLLKDRRAAIVARWTDLALEVYPEDSSGFLKGEKDRFRNPVGRITREALGSLYDGLLAGQPAEDLGDALDGIVRVRAVQDLSPDQAVGFVFLLKRAIDDELGDTATDRASRNELSALHTGIDRLALQAFGRYVVCREAIFDLRVRESHRRLSTILKRLEGPATGEADLSVDNESGQHDKGGSGA